MLTFCEYSKLLKHFFKTLQIPKMDEITLLKQNIHVACRTCLKQQPQPMFSLLGEMEPANCKETKPILIHALVEDISKMKIEIGHNNYPSLICSDCIQCLQLVLDFRMRCSKSQAILSNNLLESNDNDAEKELQEDETLQEVLVKDEHDIGEEDTDVTPVESSFNCFKKEEALKAEETIVNSSIKKVYKSYKCLRCSKVFLKQYNYEKHAEDCRKPYRGDQQYKCTSCARVFFLKTNYEKHLETHKLENCTCKICNKTFKKAKLLARHLKTHTDERPYACKVCDKRFKQSSSVFFHMRTHTGERPYLCTVCGKGFIQNSELKTHMKSHTKEKPYMCSICGIRMSMQCHFVQHMRSHTGERPYKCSYCPKAFPSTTRLKNHEVVHTGAKPYTCDACHKSFNRRSTLRVHAKIHTDERPHVCHLCGKGFIQAHCLRTHLQTHSN